MTNMTREKDLQGAVLGLCKAFRLLAYHTHDSRRSQPGFPDLVIVGPRGVLYRELKTDAGRMRPEQTDWIERLSEASQDADVWRIRDWASGRVKSELEAIRGAK